MREQEAAGGRLDGSSAGAARGGRPRRRSGEWPTRTDVLGFGFPGGGDAGWRAEGRVQGKPRVRGSRAVLCLHWVPILSPRTARWVKVRGPKSGLGSPEEGTDLPCCSPVPWDL